MNYELRITLKSDLCSASGDGFSLTIDTDVCYDEYGFPTIPSRRLKGCMLEAAQYIGAESIDEIFGVRGGERGGSLRLGNAVLENYPDLLAQAKHSGKNAQQILALFTSVRASTAIENDTAKKESLHFMRVVNHYSPLDGNEITFVAQADADEKYYDQLEKICRATRNIGYKRNRGFGAVSCRLIKKESAEKTIVGGNITDDEKNYEIRYAVRGNSPIMLPGVRSDETDDYISGTSIMGYFAGRYLKAYAADNRFEEIFLNDNVIFSNLYILSGNGAASIPASSAIAKDKTADKPLYVNLITVEKDDKRTLKPLKSGYFAEGSEIKVRTETIYHHSEGEEGTLYTQTCISEGQRFGGTISGKGKYLRDILEFLGEGIITIGRSKTAQYAECGLISADVIESADELLEYKPTDKLAAVFCSDAIFMDENGACCTEINEVCRQLGISGADKEHSFMKYKTVTGYMSAGRYKKPHLRAVKAGSTICFTAGGAPIPKIGYFGEKNGEGFGAVRFVKAEDIMELSGIRFPAEETSAAEDNSLCSLLRKNEKREEIRTKAIDYAKGNYGKLMSLTSSFVGRVLLMIRQAESYADLLERINSIKTDTKRTEAEEIARTAEEYAETGAWREYLDIVFLLAKYFNRGKE